MLDEACKRCLELTCGRVSEFAIRTNVRACLSALHATVMGFLSLFGFIFFIYFVNKLRISHRLDAIMTITSNHAHDQIIMS